MFSSPARTIGQLGAAFALACLGLGAGVHPAHAAGTTVSFWSTSSCSGSSWSACFNPLPPSHPAASPLQVTNGTAITYHIQVVTDFAVPSYSGTSVASPLISGSSFDGCDQLPTTLPHCQQNNPVMWSMSTLYGMGSIYDFYYQVTAGCAGVMPVGTNASFNASFPPTNVQSNSEFANVTGCSTGSPAPTSVSPTWTSPSYVGWISYIFAKATQVSNGFPVTSGDLDFMYGGTGCGTAGQTGIGYTSVDSAGSGTVPYTFTAPGTYTIWVQYTPHGGSNQYQPSCGSGSMVVLPNPNTSTPTPNPTPTPTPTPAPGSGVSTNVSVAWGNPVSQNASQLYSGTVHSKGNPVTVGTLWFGYGGVACGSGVTNMGSAPVNGNGTGAINYAFSNPGSYVISVGYKPPAGSLLQWSCSSSGLTVSPVSSSSPSSAPSPTALPAATPNIFVAPSGASFFAPASQLPATGTTSVSATAVASAPPVAAGTVVQLGTAPAAPRQLPELQVLNAGSVLALQALNAGPVIATLDILAVLGLMWHIRRRVGQPED